MNADPKYRRECAVRRLANAPVGSRPASEDRSGDYPTWHGEQDGMTYRQWLVGQILAGLAGNVVAGAEGGYARSALALADAAIDAQVPPVEEFTGEE